MSEVYDFDMRDYASIEKSRPARTTWQDVPWADCPDCGDSLVSPMTHECDCRGQDPYCEECDGSGISHDPLVWEGTEAVCLGCGLIWTWNVGEHAYLSSDPIGRADDNAIRILKEATKDP